MTTEKQAPSLECKYATRLSRFDYNLLNLLAESSGYTPQQVGRFAIRKYLREKLSENPSLIGG